MCGIVGVFDPARRFKPHDFDNMIGKLRHRGPDSHGMYLDQAKGVFLGHTRLSIVDLSEQGSQPLTRGHATISFNGEIYNYLTLRGELIELGYTFTSETDTEVVLLGYLAWGTDLFSKLNGMFALCIYDAEKCQFVLARDKSGEKPIYYFSASGIFAFASELKALVWNNFFARKINLSALVEYLNLGYTKGDHTLIQGFYKLLPGSYAVFNFASGSMYTSQYFHFSDLQSNYSAVTKEAVIEQLHDLLVKAVSLQLMGDVPVANLLSGGLDSSIITALTANIASSVSTYTITNPKNRDFDEAVYAREIASFFGTNHTEVPIQELSGALVNDTIRHFDEPIGDSSSIPTAVICHEIGKNFKVALGGDGADELFGGYVTNNREYFLHKYFRIFQNPGGAQAFKLVNKFLPKRNLFEHLQAYLCNFIPNYGEKFSHEQICLLMNGENPTDFVFLHPRLAGPIINRLGQHEFSNYLANDILIKTDRASMFKSIELRSPFLDGAVIDFAFTKIPDELKANGSERKIILKILAQDILPKNFNVHRKKGFSIPSDLWLSAVGGYTNVMNTIRGSNILHLPNDSLSVQDLISTRSKTNEKLFLLYSFALWEDAYGISI